jgi:hypothetical protein
LPINVLMSDILLFITTLLNKRFIYIVCDHNMIRVHSVSMLYRGSDLRLLVIRMTETRIT